MNRNEFSWLMLIHYTLVGLLDVFTFIPAYTLFLRNNEIDMLPQMYLGASLAGLVLSVLYFQLATSFSYSKLIWGNLVVVLIMTLGIYSSLELPRMEWLIFSLPIWYELLRILNNFHVLGLSAYTTAGQQSKHLHGMFGMSRHLAGLLGGLLALLLLRHAGVSILFLIGAVITVLLLASSFIMSRLFMQFSQATKGRADGNGSTFGLFKDNYIILIFIQVILTWIIFYVIENAFFNQARPYYPDHDQLAGFLAYFLAGTSVITLPFSFLGSSKVRLFGIKSLFILPGILFVMILFLFGGGRPEAQVLSGWTFRTDTLVFGAILAIKFLYNFLYLFTNIPATHLLYQPLTLERRVQVQVVADCFLTSLAVGLAGLILLPLTSLDITNLMIVLLPILAVLVGVIFFLNRQYPAKLDKLLDKRQLDDLDILLEDASSIAVLQQALQSSHPGRVLCALKVLSQSGNTSRLTTDLPALLAHPAPAVRQEALHHIEALHLTSETEKVKNLITMDDSPAVRAVALHTLSALDPINSFEKIVPYLNSSEFQVRQEAFTGLLRYGIPHVKEVMTERLSTMIASPDLCERIFAAQVLGAAPGADLCPLLDKLLADESLEVQRAALAAAGKTKCQQLWPQLLQKIYSPQLRATAAVALVAGGEATLSELQTALTTAGQDRETLKRLARIIGRIGGPKATAFLSKHLAWPERDVRTQILEALSRCGYQAGRRDKEGIEAQIKAEIIETATILQAKVDLLAFEGESPALSLLQDALRYQFEQTRRRIFLLLFFLYPTPTEEIFQVRLALTLGITAASDKEAQEAAQKLGKLSLSPDLILMLSPLFNESALPDRLARLTFFFPQAGQPSLQSWEAPPNNWGCEGVPPNTVQTRPEERLYEIMTNPTHQYIPWTKACALHAVGALKLTDEKFIEAVTQAISLDLQNPLRYFYHQVRQFLNLPGGNRPPSQEKALLTETATRTLVMLNGANRDHLFKIARRAAFPQVAAAIPPLEQLQQGGKIMLSTIEKVITLKDTDLFSKTPDEVLAEVAQYLEEVEYEAGKNVFQKGEQGDWMYIIVEGKVKAHDGETFFNYLGNSEIFGEMSVFGTEPRSASITAVEDTLLLRLDKKPLYELMEDRAEVWQGVISVLSGRLRNRLNDITQLKAEVRELSRP
jgi:HEAT repeat protein